MSAGTEPDETADPAFRAPDNLGRQLVRYLERDITHLRLRPGAKLVEEELCRIYGVSRSPIREALHLLEGFGLVVKRPRRGVFVAPMTVQDLDHLYACRAPLEGLAAADAAVNRSDELVERLRAALRRAEAAAELAHEDKAFEANVQLTTILHEATTNTVLQRTLAGLDRQALRYRRYCYGRAPRLIATDLEANRRLVEEIDAGDAEAARRTTEALIDHSRLLIRAVLAAVPAAELTIDEKS